MNLPLELLDEILSYLPSDDKQGKRSLRNCSLVAKSWVNPSQRRLFETVEIWERNLWSWLINISPENEGLLQHVRSLSYTRVRQRYSLEPEYTIRAFGGYLQSFQQLRHLSLSSIRIPSAISNQIKVFSAFQHTLSRLSFEDCSITISALATLIGYFPSLDHLDLIDPLYNTHGPPAVPISRPPVSNFAFLTNIGISSFSLEGYRDSD